MWTLVRCEWQGKVSSRSVAQGSDTDWTGKKKKKLNYETDGGSVWFALMFCHY